MLLMVICQSVVAADSVTIYKRLIEPAKTGENLLSSDGWRPWELGFERQAAELFCDNGANSHAQRGAGQTIQLNQTTPAPIVASAWSRCENVGGSANANYALYLDLIYQDGSHLWGQHASFETGTHDWQQRRVVILPEKPVRSVSFYLLFRQHSGRAWFRRPHLEVRHTPKGAALFDGVAVSVEEVAEEGFQVRDVAANSGFAKFERDTFDLRLDCDRRQKGPATVFDVTITNLRNSDRAITLLYTIPIAKSGLVWFDGPRESRSISESREYTNSSRFHVGANGRLSRYPLGAVGNASNGQALAIDMSAPAFFRIGYAAGSQELYLAYDIGLTPEKPAAQLRFCKFEFDPDWKFRSALEQYYQLFPECFRRRIDEHGMWMPFAKISQVRQWQDFGFKFKEGNNETGWDDQHNIVTFRYTEPMTWWMKMPDALPRTTEAAEAYARELAADPANQRAQAWLTSGYQDRDGKYVARILDTPWCDGAAWSMNSMPNIPGQTTDFSLKWNDKIRRQLYGPDQDAELDGEYIDSSEGYVTDELDYCRDHFAAADTPLCFGLEDRQPAVFRGLIAFEYIRQIAEDVHRMDKLMMANSTPIRLCWLAPLLDVLGTETNWHSGGEWRPMSDADLLYRRALCRGKPYCFLMNTRFEDFSHGLVERYMKRSLAYGFFPGFFSHNAAQGHYFKRPEFYERDRDLFRKYVPLCRLLSEAGWRPMTGARCRNELVYLERFGNRYLTVFNSNSNVQTVTIHFDASWVWDSAQAEGRDLTGSHELTWRDGAVTLTLAGEDVAVLDLAAAEGGELGE
jgi:hypothetical protein